MPSGMLKEFVMTKKEKQIFLYIAFAVGLFALVTHLELVFCFVSYIVDLFMPVIVGLIMAFVLNVPVTGFENLFRRIFKNRKHIPREKAVHFISIFLSVVCVALVIAILCILVIPELVKTVKSIVTLIEAQWPDWLATLEKHNINTVWLKDKLADFDWQNIISRLSGYAGNIVGSIASIASSTATVVSLAITGIIIALYILADRNKLGNQAKNVLYAYTKSSFADRCLYVCGLIKKAYTKFLTGQCVEALLLGVLITTAFAIFRLPYASLVGTVTAICALIPYIGAFISCGFGVVLCLMANPQKVFICIIVYLAVQFVETQFIYPKVVGSSVGLSPLWTLIAVLIGGKLFGLVGMIFFIPLVSVAYILVKEDVIKRQKIKERNMIYENSDPKL